MAGAVALLRPWGAPLHFSGPRNMMIGKKTLLQIVVGVYIEPYQIQTTGSKKPHRGFETIQPGSTFDSIWLLQPNFSKVIG